MAQFPRKYSDAQIDAAITASLDRGVTGPRILQLASEGTLRGADGVPVPPFDMPLPTLRSYVHKERRKRKGVTRRHVSDVPHGDAIEQLRRRLVSAADAMLEHFERAQKTNPKHADPERLRQIVRLVREAAALPSRGDDRPVAPGQRQPSTGKRAVGDGPTQGGLAKQILADHQAQGRTAQDNPTPSTQAREHTTPGAEPNTAHVQTETGAAPGSIALASVTAMRA
jgi:hypothetical protein